MKSAFVSGNILRKVDGEDKHEMVRILSIHNHPMGEGGVEEHVIQTVYETPEGGFIRKDDRELADQIRETLDELGYEVVVREHKVLQTYSQLDQTILSGNFEVKEIENK